MSPFCSFNWISENITIFLGLNQWLCLNAHSYSTIIPTMTIFRMWSGNWTNEPSVCKAGVEMHTPKESTHFWSEGETRRLSSIMQDENSTCFRIRAHFAMPTFSKRWLRQQKAANVYLHGQTSSPPVENLKIDFGSCRSTFPKSDVISDVSGHRPRSNTAKSAVDVGFTGPGDEDAAWGPFTFIRI